MSPDPLASRLIGELVARGLTVATCESLTGGLVGATLTGVPGASAAYRGGLVTYASDLKGTLAGVDPAWISSHGVINARTAEMMAAGCARVCGADLGLSCTGVAGPDPQDGEPVGTVYVCARLACPDRSPDHRGDPLRLDLSGDRWAIRDQTVSAVLQAGLRVVAGTS